MPINEVSESGQKFLIQLFEQTGGDPSVQVSMYRIGELLGLEREAATRVAEDLIGLQLVEIRTLSGGIGISADGSEMVQNLIGPAVSDDGKVSKLTGDRVLSTAACLAVEQIATELKSQTGKLGLDFGTLSELMADLKTIDAQLDSTRPKTAIIKECLRSIQAVLNRTESGGIVSRVRALLDD
jgi:hypothetical protein